MALLHVEISGKDRRRLTDLVSKYRVVVVAYRENARPGTIVVDAYLPPRRVPWLEKKGYDVTVLEDVEPAARRRQREGHQAARALLQASVRGRRVRQLQ